jgi:uncharacterized protein (UPF0332 family)
MSVTYQEFAAFAEQLAKQPTEIEWRNSVSRTYYAAYHQALSVSDRCPEIAKESAGVHQALINRFNRQGTRDARNIAQGLWLMKKLRNIADYEWTMSSSKGMHNSRSLITKTLQTHCVVWTKHPSIKGRLVLIRFAARHPKPFIRPAANWWSAICFVSSHGQREDPSCLLLKPAPACECRELRKRGLR